jgi:thymidylate synthase (FAD)
MPTFQKIEMITRVCTGTQDKCSDNETDAIKFCSKLIERGHMSPFEHVRLYFEYDPVHMRTLHYKDDKTPYGVSDRIGKYDGYHYSSNCRDLIAEGETLKKMLEYEEEADYMTVCFDIDIGLSRELIRHRQMSFMERSTRYCTCDTFVIPLPIWNEWDRESRADFECYCYDALTNYTSMLRGGVQKQYARAMLPLCTATKLYVTGMYKQWVDVLKLRLGTGSHPSMKYVMNKLISLPEFPEQIKKEVLA